MKTQSFGRSGSVQQPFNGLLHVIFPFGRGSTPDIVGTHFRSPSCKSLFNDCVNALKDYREHRENGDERDNPQEVFPSAGLDTLCSMKKNCESSHLSDLKKKWPDKEGRYWWELKSKSGQEVNDFYWMQDTVRGYPDRNGRYWFTVHHALSETKIAGFSARPDNVKGYPKEEYYWSYIQYTQCEDIQQWMKEKDNHYLTRLKREEEAVAPQKLLADNGNVAAQFEIGVFLTTQQERTDYSKAYSYLQKAAQQNYPLASCYLGLLYDEYGLVGSQPSIEAALFLYAKTDSRFPLQQVLLAVCYLRDFKAAMGLAAKKATDLLKAASQPVSMYQAYDYGRILSFFKERQTLSAYVFLAMVYTGGLLGVAQNSARAEFFFDKIAECTDAWTEHNIALMYEKGFWMEQDDQKAKKWYELAANKGLTSAQLNLSLFLLHQLDRLDRLREANLLRQLDCISEFDPQEAERCRKLMNSPSRKRSQLDRMKRDNLQEAERWRKLADSASNKLSPRPLLAVEPLPSRGFALFKALFSASQNLASDRQIEHVPVPMVRVLYDWEADRHDRLSIRKDEILYVLHQDSDWRWCKNHEDCEGKVPRNFIEELPMTIFPVGNSSDTDLPVSTVKISEDDIRIERKLEKGKEEESSASSAPDDDFLKSDVNKIVPEFDLENINGSGNCFYHAVGLQLNLTHRRFLQGLNVPAGAGLHDSLRLWVQGENFQDRTWGEYEELYRLAERSNSVVAIIDTRYPHLGFRAYFINNLEVRQETYRAVEVPFRPIIRLAYTGDHFLSVRSHPVLATGALRSAFNGDVLGGYSLSSTAARLSTTRFAFTSHSGSAANQMQPLSGTQSNVFNSTQLVILHSPMIHPSPNQSLPSSSSDLPDGNTSNIASSSSFSSFLSSPQSQVPISSSSPQPSSSGSFSCSSSSSQPPSSSVFSPAQLVALHSPIIHSSPNQSLPPSSSDLSAGTSIHSNQNRLNQ